jgi:hypothetical protein
MPPNLPAISLAVPGLGIAASRVIKRGTAPDLSTFTYGERP